MKRRQGYNSEVCTWHGSKPSLEYTCQEKKKKLLYSDRFALAFEGNHHRIYSLAGLITPAVMLSRWRKQQQRAGRGRAEERRRRARGAVVGSGEGRWRRRRTRGGGARRGRPTRRASPHPAGIDETLNERAAADHRRWLRTSCVVYSCNVGS